MAPTPRKNAEGYLDLTAHDAIRHVEEERSEELRHKKLIQTIVYLCNLAGYKVEGRIVLTDRYTGKTWR